MISTTDFIHVTELPGSRKMKALQLMMRGRGTRKGAFFLPNLIVEKANMVQGGT
jgi:hypothetical protein